MKITLAELLGRTGVDYLDNTGNGIPAAKAIAEIQGGYRAALCCYQISNAGGIEAVIVTDSHKDFYGLDLSEVYSAFTEWLITIGIVGPDEDWNTELAGRMSILEVTIEEEE